MAEVPFLFYVGLLVAQGVNNIAKSSAVLLHRPSPAVCAVLPPCINLDFNEIHDTLAGKS